MVSMVWWAVIMHTCANGRFPIPGEMGGMAHRSTCVFVRTPWVPSGTFDHRARHPVALGPRDSARTDPRTDAPASLNPHRTSGRERPKGKDCRAPGAGTFDVDRGFQDENRLRQHGTLGPARGGLAGENQRMVPLLPSPVPPLGPSPSLPMRPSHAATPCSSSPVSVKLALAHAGRAETSPRRRWGAS